MLAFEDKSKWLFRPNAEVFVTKSGTLDLLGKGKLQIDMDAFILMRNLRQIFKTTSKVVAYSAKLI